MNRQSYAIARMANKPKDDFEYVIAKIDVASRVPGSIFAAWQEVLPTSATGPLTYTVLPGGRSGTVDREPAMCDPGIAFAPGFGQPYVVLLKTGFYSKGVTNSGIKSAWLLIANLPIS